MYLAGELAGTPLIKLGLNAGVDVADRIANDLASNPAADNPTTAAADGYDLVIVGAGAAGLAAARRAQVRGLSIVVLDAGRWGQTIRDMYRGKTLFAEPAAVTNRSEFWFEECSREALLERWQQQLGEFALNIREHESVVELERDRDGFRVITGAQSYHAHRVLLTIGKSGHPRKAAAQGEAEHANKIGHVLSDPDAHRGQRILVYGGGDVAVEAALRLCDENEVTLVTVDAELTYPRKRNRDALQSRAQGGEIALHLASELTSIEADAVTFRDAQGADHRVANDVVFEMIGSELPLAFFKRVGIKLDQSWDAGRYVLLGIAFLLTYSLYALKKYPETPYSWPFNLLIQQSDFERTTRGVFDATFWPFAWLFEPAALTQIHSTLWFQQGYLYSLLYTLAMVVFGSAALHRWGRVARDKRYQRWRYRSLIGFQVGFFLIAHVLAVQALSIQHAWRAWGLYQPWPLFFNTFHWFQSSDPDVVRYGFIGTGLFGTLVAIPWAAHRHGKRFCTWICGCGGLAETLGDRFRHLSAKGESSQAWEFQGLVVLAAATIATVVSVGAFGTRADNAWAASYSYVVDFWLVAVIPIALYPFFGGKVWCRYWCPLAAYNQVLARWYGQLQIAADDKCISCTQCSRQCQVGVDVMAFAKAQQPFDNRNSACIQCGICIDVCPMDVLTFEQRDRPKTRLPVLPNGDSEQR